MMDGLLKLVLLFLWSLIGNVQEVSSKEFLRVCYFTNWSKHRSSPYARFDIKNIEPGLCTHLIYAFAKIDVPSKLMVPAEPLEEESRPGHVGRYRQFTQLKKKQPHLKTLLSIGGQYAGNDGFKAITENDVILARFASNTVDFLRNRDFDGLDIDWEYPTKETETRFINLLQALHRAFQNDHSGHSKLLLTIAGPAGKWTIDDGFDIPSIARFVDYVNLMTYDYHVAGSEVAAFNSPLYSRKDIRFNPTLSTNWSVHYWVERGLPLSKALVGVTGVGRRFVLANVNHTLVGSGVTKESRKGNFYGIGSGLAYPEICLMLASISTETFFDHEQGVPFLVNDDEWVGYEDPRSLKGKVEWMLKTGVAGIMMWSLDQDDFTGQVCDQGKYPLLNAIKTAVFADKNTDVSNNVNGNINFITKRNNAPGHVQLICLPLFVTLTCLQIIKHISSFVLRY